MRSKFLSACASLFLLLLTGCGGTSFSQGVRNTEINVLTGLPGKNGPVVAVKFDDTREAHPQDGVEKADVVFVTEVEGGLTRLMAIYSSEIPEQLAPIRSARISDIDILAQFGKAGFIYSGSQRKMRPILANANLVNMSAERNPATIFFNDPNRITPYAMTVRTTPLLARHPEIGKVKPIGYTFGKLTESSMPVIEVDVRWPNARYTLRWNKEERRFVIDHNGIADLAVTGKQLGSNCMIIQMVEIHPSEFHDKVGGITPKSTVVGSGVAYLLRDGTVTKVKWSRKSPESTTQWSLEDGSPAPFATGQVWFLLTDKEPEFHYASAPDTKSSGSTK